VDIGRRMHVLEAGEGSPTVVIVPALGESVLGWVPVWRVLTEHTHVCVYDRAGIGWSDSPPAGRRTFAEMADELHRALSAAGIAPPYLVVGHSLGGIIGRRFAARYPGEVSGVVLVDSSHEDQVRRLGTRLRLRLLRHLLQRCVCPLGLRRLAAIAGLAHRLDADLAREIPAEHTAAARAITLSSRQRRMHVREMLLMIRSHSQPPDLGFLPLTVLTAGDKDPRWALRWAPMQADLVSTSARSRHLTASNAGHYVHLDDPELVIQSVRDLLHELRPPGGTV